MEKKGVAGYLIAGLAGAGNMGYLFVPYEAVGPGPLHAIDPYELGRAIGNKAYWLPMPEEHHFLDQPLRYVQSMDESLLTGDQRAMVKDVRFSHGGGFMSPFIHVSALRCSDDQKIAANVYEAPRGMASVEEGTFLEIYMDYVDIEHLPWSLREAPSPA